MTTPMVENYTENMSESEIKFDVVGHLPVEIAQQILFDLSPEDLHSATFCCSRWNAALRNDYFWKRLCERDGYFEVEESERSEFYDNFLTKYNYWQGVYWYGHTLHRNWETNNYREDIYEVEKPEYGHACWWCLDEVFAYANLDKDGLKMYVHDLRSKEFKLSIFPMRVDLIGDYGELKQSGNYLIYFVHSECLGVWNFVNGTIIVDVNDEVWEHVTGVHLYKNLIVLQTYTKEFEVFNIETEEIEYKYPQTCENLIFEDGKIIFSTGRNINILKWDDKSTVTLTCCQSVYDRKLLIKNDILLSFCENCRSFNSCLCIWNTTTSTKLQSILWGRMPDLRGIFLIDKYFYVKRYNGAEKNYVIEFWEYLNGTPKVTAIARTKLDLYSTSSNEHFMVAPSEVGVWCLRTRNLIPITNVKLVHGDHCEIKITKTKLTYVIRTALDEQTCASVFVHRRDYEV